VPEPLSGIDSATMETALDDVRDPVRRVLERLEPSPGGLEATLRRVRRRERNRRIGAAALSLLLTGGLAAGLWLSFGRHGTQPASTPSPTPRAVSGEARLFLAGDGQIWIVDTHTDSVRHLDLPELSPGDPPFRIERRGDKLVLWGGYRTYVLDPADDSALKVLVRDSWIFIPSAVPDRVWVGVVDPKSGGARRLAAVREVAIDGRVTVPDTRPPDGRWPVAAVQEGLVFQVPDEDTLEVWDPHSGEVIRRLPGGFPLAWQGHRLAWCDAQCEEAHITDFSSGADRVIPLPQGIFHFKGYQGAFSPDGSVLALIGMTDEKYARADLQLMLVDVETGDAEAVPGTVVQPYYNFVDWSPSGDSVFITGGERFEQRRLIEYRPDEGDVRVLPVEVGDFYGMAAA